MTKLTLLLLLLPTITMAWADADEHDLRVEVKREGSLYSFEASFATPLKKCDAYRYLTDYQAEKDMPGVIESLAYRQSANRVMVERTFDEHVLFFDIRLHSVMEYTENPFDGISFIQLAGDSKSFQGSWAIEPNRQGSTLRFRGLWEPDTVIPLFIIDHFVKDGLIDKFNIIASLADKRAQQGFGKRSDMTAGRCVN